MKDIKGKIILVLSVFIAVLLFVSLGYKALYSKEKLIKKELIEYIEISNDTVELLRDKNGQMFSRVQSLEASIETINNLPDKQAIKDIVGQIKNLQAIVKIETQAKGNVVAPVRDTILKIDTVYEAKVFDFSDGFLTINCVVADTARCPYNYLDSASVVLYRRKAFRWYQFWKWGKKISTCEVRLKNPNAKTIEVSSLIVK